ncbi:MerR family transcriptional regulator [Sebaldella sp. S0638]|uniref:MerR family transcriptional regulator n=1 Tax=Sebaldella sp. S0638 TaxID=2957809 RepID=UPI00209E9DC3|nr:MerR family transcriptional regulator [Sebaldella sp. S0638]MCP1224551.1 MerR family transcriptional regulator [Sebaldella sp. S0638]
MLYSIGEMSKMMNIAPSTLRYYDKEGLLPFVKRSDGGIRQFGESDFEWLSIIHCLKQAGMPIKDIKKYLDMITEGDSNIGKRLEIFKKQRAKVEKQIEELTQTLRVLEYKCWYYEIAKEKGSVDPVENMNIEDMPEKYGQVKEKLNSLKLK